MSILVTPIGNQALTYIKPKTSEKFPKSLTFLEDIQKTPFKAKVANRASHKICFDIRSPDSNVTVKVGDKELSFKPSELISNITKGTLFCKLVIDLRDSNLPKIKVNLSSSDSSNDLKIHKYKSFLNSDKFSKDLKEIIPENSSEEKLLAVKGRS